MPGLVKTQRVAGDNTNYSIYELANDNLYTMGKISISVANVAANSGNPTNVFIAITSNTVVATGDYIEYQTSLDMGDSGLERAGITIKPGDKVWIKSTAQPVDVRINGFLYNTVLDDVTSVSDHSTINSWKTVYTVPSSTALGNIADGVLSLSIINTDNTAATVSVAISSATPPEDGTYLCKDLDLAAYGDGVIYSYKVVKPGEQILVYSNTNGIAVRVDGLLRVA